MKTKFDNSVLKPIADVKSKAAFEIKKDKRPQPKFIEDESHKF